MINKILIIFGLVCLVFIALCALATSFTSSAASLANGAAMTSLSSALLVQQCAGLMLAILGLGGGISIGLALRRRQADKSATRRSSTKLLPAAPAYRLSIPQQQGECFEQSESDDIQARVLELIDGDNWGWP
jgi:hypothetical protein